MSKITKSTPAFEEGLRDFAKVPMDACPHKLYTPAYDEWRRGWWHAYAASHTLTTDVTETI